MSKKLRKLKKEYRESTPKEIREAILENTLYGFLGSTLIVFISSGVDIAVLVSYLVYYFFLGRVVNRPKYVTSLGKFILFQVPTALGAFIGYKVAGYISYLI